MNAMPIDVDNVSEIGVSYVLENTSIAFTLGLLS